MKLELTDKEFVLIRLAVANSIRVFSLGLNDISSQEDEDSLKSLIKKFTLVLKENVGETVK